MMYSEFVAGTGCKDNAHNYEVFQNLEAMYMNTDMSKAEIYEYGKKLVDNSKSEAELKLEAELKAEIEGLKSEIEYHKTWAANCQESVDFWKESGDKAMTQMNRRMRDYHLAEAKAARAKIITIKHFFNI